MQMTLKSLEAMCQLMSGEFLALGLPHDMLGMESNV